MAKSSPRRPKLAALPDVMTSPPMQLLACALRQRRRLSFEALGKALGLSEHDATTLCRGDESVVTVSVQTAIVAHVAQALHDTTAEAQAKFRWNQTADRFNQWSHLGGDEQAALIQVETIQQLEQWAATPPHGRRGLVVTDLVQQALDGDDNELVRLHRRAVADGMTTQDFAAAVGVSRQRLWVLEQDGHGVGFARAVARAKTIGG